MEDPATEAIAPRGKTPIEPMDSEPQRPLGDTLQQEGKVDRIVSNARSLASDLVDMVDLKMQLVQVHVEEQIEQRVGAVARQAVMVTVAALAVVFVLVSAALLLGRLLDNDALGFLVVAGVLAIIALVLWRLGEKNEKSRMEEPDSESGLT